MCTKFLALAVAVITLLGLSGCESEASRLEKESLRDQVRQLQEENARLSQELAAAKQQVQSLQSEIRTLNEEINRLRALIPPTPKPPLTWSGNISTDTEIFELAGGSIRVRWEIAGEEHKLSGEKPFIYLRLLTEKGRYVWSTQGQEDNEVLAHNIEPGRYYFSIIINHRVSSYEVVLEQF